MTNKTALTTLLLLAAVNATGCDIKEIYHGNDVRKTTTRFSNDQVTDGLTKTETLTPYTLERGRSSGKGYSRTKGPTVKAYQQWEGDIDISPGSELPQIESIQGKLKLSNGSTLVALIISNGSTRGPIAFEVGQRVKRGGFEHEDNNIFPQYKTGAAQRFSYTVSGRTHTLHCRQTPTHQNVWFTSDVKLGRGKPQAVDFRLWHDDKGISSKVVISPYNHTEKERPFTWTYRNSEEIHLPTADARAQFRRLTSLCFSLADTALDGEVGYERRSK